MHLTLAEMAAAREGLAEITAKQRNHGGVFISAVKDMLQCMEAVLRSKIEHT